MQVSNSVTEAQMGLLEKSTVLECIAKELLQSPGLGSTP